MIPALGKRGDILHHRRRSKSRLRCYPNSKAIGRTTTTWIRTKMNPRRKKKKKKISLCFYSSSRSRDDDDVNNAMTRTTARVLGRCRRDAMLRSCVCVYICMYIRAREFLLLKRTPHAFFTAQIFFSDFCGTARAFLGANSPFGRIFEIVFFCFFSSIQKSCVFMFYIYIARSGKTKYTARRHTLAVREAFEETTLSLSLSLSLSLFSWSA